MTTLTCIRPITTGTQDRNILRRGDYVRCKCGKPTCRDADLKDNA